MCTLKRRIGFTLMEVLIAAAVLSMLFTILYKVYASVTNSFKRSNWTLKTQSAVRNQLTYIREEMQRASYKSVVTPSSVTIDDGPNYQFKTSAPNQPDLQEHTGSAGEVAKWVICKPEKNIGVAEPGFEITCTLKYQGKKLLYTRAIAGTAPNEKTLTDKVLLEDVEKIGVRLQDEDPGSQKVARLFVLKVWIKHPDAVHFPNMWVEEQTAAKIEVLTTP